MMKVYFPTIILSICFTTVVGQFNSAKMFAEDEQNRDFTTLQSNYNSWKDNHILDSAKGWKWYARWQEHQLKRTDGSGNLVHNSVFLKESIKFQHNTSSASKANTYAWVPAGPENLFEPDSFPNYGLGRINCVAFHPSDSNIFFVGVAQGGIWKTSNGGSSWTPLNDGLPILRINDIAINPSNTNIMYACVGDYEYNGVSLELDDRKRHTHYGVGLYKTTDGGQNWTPTGLTLLQTDFDNSLLSRVVINPNATNEVLAGGVEGLWRSTNSGSTWTKVYDNIISDIEFVDQDPEVVYAATSYIYTLDEGEAGIIKSSDFGENWTKLFSTIPTDGTAERVQLNIAPSDSAYIFAIACNTNGGLQGIYASENSGQTWTKRHTGLNLLSWDGTGNSGQGTYDLDIIIDPDNRKNVYTGGVMMFGTDDAGLSWDVVSHWYTPGCVHADIHRFEYNPLNGSLYVCHDGGISRTNAPKIGSLFNVLNSWTYRLPTRWTHLASGMQITSFYRLGLRQSHEGHIIAGAQDNGTRHTKGGTWEIVGGGDGMECALFQNDTSSYVYSSQYGRINRRIGNSNLWYSAPGGGEWTTPFFVDTAYDQLFAGFSDLYVTNIYTNNWSKQSSFPNMPSAGRPSLTCAMAQSSKNPSTIYLAKRVNFPENYPSKMYMSTNRGLTWNDISVGLPDSLYYTYLYVDRDSSNRAWVTVSGFVEGVKIFETQDGGNTWQNISYNLPNVPTNCVIMDESSNDHRLYLSNDLGVFVMADGLNEWVPFNNELPNVIVSELEIHYPTNSIYAATFGRGVWKSELLDTTFTGTTSMISHINQEIDFRLIPNPNAGAFTIDFNSDVDDEATMEIIDIMGKVVYVKDLQIIQGTNNMSIELPLQSGQYFTRIYGESFHAVKKFIVI